MPSAIIPQDVNHAEIPPPTWDNGNQTIEADFGGQWDAAINEVSRDNEWTMVTRKARSVRDMRPIKPMCCLRNNYLHSIERAGNTVKCINEVACGNGNWEKNTVTVFFLDNLYRLAQTFLTAHNPTKELTGARVAAILDRAEVAYPTGVARSIATGTVELGGGGSYSIAEGTNVKAYFDEITYSAERGRIFVDREGVLVSQNRLGVVLSNAVAVFSDTNPLDIPYRALGITFAAEDIVNRVAVTPAGGSQQLAQDSASQTKYFIKALYVDGSLLHDNTAALDLANYLLFPEPEYRFDHLETFYGSLTAAERDKVAIIEVGDAEQIEKQITNCSFSGTRFSFQ
jgi:hypothetical protein